MSNESHAPQDFPRIPAGTAIVVLILCLFWLVQGFAAIGDAYRHDFLNLYTGASLARDGRFGDLYGREVQLARERELVPETPELVPFVRPHFYAVLLMPISLLPYGTALKAWVLLQTMILMACWVWGWKRFGSDALIFAALYFPPPAGISNGQDSAVMLLIAVAAYMLYERGRLFASGAVLALGLAKFHLLLLVPLAFVLQKRWLMFWGFCAAAALEVLISAILGGFAGMEQYVRLLLAKDVGRLSPAPEKMLNVHSFGVNFGVEHVALSAVLVIMVLALVVIAIWQAPFWRALAAALTGGLLVVPHVYAYDAAILLLPLLLVIFQSKQPASRMLALAFLTPLPFFTLVIGPPWSALPALVLSAFLIALAREGYLERASLELARGG